MQYYCSEKGNRLQWSTHAGAMAIACWCVGQRNGMHRGVHYGGKSGKVFITHLKKKGLLRWEQSFLNRCKKELLYLGNDSLECFGVIHGQVSENLTVDLDTSLVQKTHQLRIAQTLETSGSIDTLNPQ